MTDDPLFYVVIAAVLLVGAILAYGIIGFGTGMDGKKSNKIMQWRIAAQLMAVLLLLGFVAIRRMTTGEG